MRCHDAIIAKNSRHATEFKNFLAVSPIEVSLFPFSLDSGVDALRKSLPCDHILLNRKK
jgi:hypothetical protein